MPDEPETVVRDFLRTRLTDPNSSRVAGTAYIEEVWPVIDNLQTNHYPRISVLKLSEPSRPFGLGSTKYWYTARIQVDVWTKSDQVLTISSVAYEGDKLARKITRDIITAFETYWVSDLANTNKAILFRVENTSSPEIDYDYRVWKQPITISLENMR